MALKISRLHGFVNIQIIGEKNLEIAKSFLCNLHFLAEGNEVMLSQILFVATDLKTFTFLQEFKLLYPTKEYAFSVALEFPDRKNRVSKLEKYIL